MIAYEPEDVEKMIEDGKEIVLRAVHDFKPIKIIAAFSGGNDSIVSTHFAVSEFQAPVLHCDTGIGLQKTRAHVEIVATNFEWNLRVEKAQPEGRTDTTTDEVLPRSGWLDGVTAYEEFVFNFGFPGPGMHARMYQRLKERSFRKYCRELKAGTPEGSKVIIISGIRGDESAIRAGYKRAIQQDPGNSSMVWVNPFYWRSTADFEMYRQEFGIPRNPCKDLVGISGECLCGAYAHAEYEKQAIREIEPGMADYIGELERITKDRGLPCEWGKKPKRRLIRDVRAGQNFLFEPVEPEFMPMCVGCNRRPKC
jgi:3'-phosphoadenosine 5'-phosphosulfate sulfotransferase (PAPS reductase)/FAD synthetase